MSTLMTFPKFSQLPFELREKIWKLCLPRRVIELNLPNGWGETDDKGQIHCDWMYTFLANHTAPVLWSVNREARQVALTYCGPKSDNELRIRRGLPRQNVDDDRNESSLSAVASLSVADFPSVAASLSAVFSQSVVASQPATSSQPVVASQPATSSQPVVTTQSALRNRCWRGNMIDVLTGMDTDPDLPGFWFNPRTDTPVLYSDPKSEGMQHLLTGRAPLYGQLSQEQAFLNLFFEGEPCTKNGCPHPDFGHMNMALPDCEWEDPLVVMSIIAIHASKDAARKSGLFGHLGDEPIQLVDPFDRDRVAEYFRFFQEAKDAGREQTSVTEKWFRAWTNGFRFECLLPAKRKKVVQKSAVRRAWEKAHEAGKAIPNEDAVWHKPAQSQPFGGLFPADLLPAGLSLLFATHKWRPNLKHPWVQDVLDRLPSLRPRLMIRLCADGTCLGSPKEWNEAWEKKEVSWCG